MVRCTMLRWFSDSVNADFGTIGRRRVHLHVRLSLDAGACKSPLNSSQRLSIREFWVAISAALPDG